MKSCESSKIHALNDFQIPSRLADDRLDIIRDSLRAASHWNYYDTSQGNIPSRAFGLIRQAPLYADCPLCYNYSGNMDIVSIVISLFVILFAITIHETAHGWAAFKLGDPTAYSMGRLTLNPIAHIDPIGTVVLPLILVIMGAPPFGWAKPVPVNPYNFKNPKRDNLIVSAAGPLSNFAAAFLSLIALLLLKGLRPSSGFSIRARGFSPGIFPSGRALSDLLLHDISEHSAGGLQSDPNTPP